MAIVSLPHAPMIGFKRNALSVVRGVYNEFEIHVQNEDGSSVDLTGLDVFLVAYRNRQIEEDMIHYVDPIVRQDSTGTYITILDPLDGRVQVLLPGILTEAIDPDLYWYDLWYVDGTGNDIMLINKAEFKVRE
jgi:hypothetical protein